MSPTDTTIVAERPGGTESSTAEDEPDDAGPATNPLAELEAFPGAAPEVYLHGIATAVPPHELPQEEVAREAASVFAGRYADFDRLRPVFENTGIDRRYAVRPFSWFREPHGWPDRTEVYLEGATALFISSATAALADAGFTADDVDTVVTVSSTGIATPSLEARALQEMGFRENILRVPVFGLGCAGGVTGLAIAANMARAQPGSVVLIVAVEVCTLAFRTDKMTKANIVATALFADGAAAAVLSTGTGCAALGDKRQRIALGASGQTTWPGTLDVMGWSIDPVGFGAIFSKSIPALVHERMRPAADAFLARHDTNLEGISDVVFHPGGARVIEALTEVFDLPHEALQTERDVLRNYGNMSAPTVLFVLAEKRRQGLHGPVLMAALGPGFTASFLTLEVS